MMKSALEARLSPEQRKLLAEYCTQRVGTLRSERDQLFDQKLTKYANRAAGDYSDRIGGARVREELKKIFDRSNKPTHVVRSVKKFILARLRKDVFSGNDWFAASPEGPTDGDLSGEIQKHAGYKLRECDWKSTGCEIIDTALDLGFAAVKTTWAETWDFSERLEMLLTEGTNPVLAKDGSFFTPEDESGTLGADGAVSAGDESEEAAEPPMMDEVAEGEPITAPKVFAKDPEVELPTAENGRKFQEHRTEEKTRLSAGLDVRLIHWKDALWPVNAGAMDLSDPACDFIGHTKTMTWEELRSTYDPDGDNQDVQERLEYLRKGGDGRAQHEGGKPKQEQGEPEVTRTDIENPSFKVTECYFRKRLPESPAESRIFVCLIEDAGCGEAMWVDYLAAMSPKSMAPLHLVPVNRVSGRAYGIGMWETYEDAEDIVDALINGVLLRNEDHANPFVAVAANSIDQSKQGGPLERGPGRTITLKQGANVKEAIQYLALPDLDQRTMDLVNLFMQLIQTESGVTNATQGDLTNLPSNGTATGVNSLLESSSVLHNFTLEEFRSGLRAPLKYGVKVLYFHQDVDETYEYLEGNAAAVMTLKDAQVLKKLDLNVDITLTRAKKQEEKEAAMAAIPLQQQFYGLPLEVQSKALPLYLQAFRANGIENPEKFFPTQEDIKQALEMQAEQQAAAAQMAAGGPQPGAEAPGEQEPQLPDSVDPQEGFAA